MKDNTELKEDVKRFSAFLDELENMDGWEIHSHSISDFWSPKDVGDEVKGIFLEKRKFQGKYKNQNDGSFCSFLLLTKNGIVGVREHTTLEEELDDLVKGEMLWITYMGEAESPSTGNTYKKYFIRRKNLNLTGDFTSAADIKKTENSQAREEPPDQGREDQQKDVQSLNKNDDPESLAMIEHYKELLKDQHKPINDKSVVKMAESDPDLTPEDRTRIKVQVVELVKNKQLKQVAV